MAQITYRIHTNIDPLFTEGVHFLTRGRRPQALNYGAWAARLTTELGATVQAIFEGPHIGLGSEALYETEVHKEKRAALMAENAELSNRMYCLHSITHVASSLHNYLTDIARAVARSSADLSHLAACADVQGIAIDPLRSFSDALSVQLFTNSVDDLNRSLRLEYVTQYSMELAYLTANCTALVPEMVAADPQSPCCDEPRYVVRLNTEREYGVADIVCSRCGHVVPPLLYHQLPTTEQIEGV